MLFLQQSHAFPIFSYEKPGSQLVRFAEVHNCGHLRGRGPSAPELRDGGDGEALLLGTELLRWFRM